VKKKKDICVWQSILFLIIYEDCNFFLITQMSKFYSGDYWNEMFSLNSILYRILFEDYFFHLTTKFLDNDQYRIFCSFCRVDWGGGHLSGSNCKLLLEPLRFPSKLTLRKEYQIWMRGVTFKNMFFLCSISKIYIFCVVAIILIFCFCSTCVLEDSVLHTWKRFFWKL